MIIAVTGTPGTGKSYFAKRLAARTGFRYLELNQWIKENGLYESYDRKAQTHEVDVNKLRKRIQPLVEKSRFDSKDQFQKEIKAQFSKLVNKNIGMNDFLKKIKPEIFKKIKPEKIKEKIKEKNNNKRQTSRTQNSSIIIDSHLSHYIKADFCLVVKRGLKSLRKEFERRNYPKQKIEDNLESEIFDICLEEAGELKQKIIIISNSI